MNRADKAGNGAWPGEALVLKSNFLSAFKEYIVSMTLIYIRSLQRIIRRMAILSYLLERKNLSMFVFMEGLSILSVSLMDLLIEELILREFI